MENDFIVPREFVTLTGSVVGGAVLKVFLKRSARSQTFDDILLSTNIRKGNPSKYLQYGWFPATTSDIRNDVWEVASIRTVGSVINRLEELDLVLQSSPKDKHPLDNSRLFFVNYDHIRNSLTQQDVPLDRVNQLLGRG